MNNYNSIHVINSTIDYTAFYIGQCQRFSKYTPNDEQNIQKFESEYNKRKGKNGSFFEQIKEVISFVSNHAQERKAKFFFLENENHVISVFSEYFDFASIKNEAKVWFEDDDGCSPDVLVVRSFDESVLELSILHNEKFITSYITGEGCKEFGMGPQQFDEEIVSELFNISKNQVINAYNEDVNIALENFSKLFGVPLNLKITDIGGKSNNKNFEEETYII